MTSNNILPSFSILIVDDEPKNIQLFRQPSGREPL